jgi:hypothetical protein
VNIPASVDSFKLLILKLLLFARHLGDATIENKQSTLLQQISNVHHHHRSNPQASPTLGDNLLADVKRIFLHDHRETHSNNPKQKKPKEPIVLLER